MLCYDAETSHTHQKRGVHAIYVVIFSHIKRDYMVLLRFIAEGRVYHG